MKSFTTDYFYLTDYLMEGLVCFDEKGRIILANKTAKDFSGYGEELTEVTLMDIFPRIVTLSKDELVFGTDELSADETCIYQKKSTCFWVKYKVTILNNDSLYGLITFYDITERNQALNTAKQAMAEIEETVVARNEFVANVTHELRTPVNGIRGMAVNLLDTALTPYQLDSINVIKRCCDNMSKIINDLLDFSKMEAGKMTLEKREFDFKKFIYETLEFNAIKIREKGLQLRVNVADNIPSRVIGDEVRLGQIINNLMSNATKFTSVGHISFEVVVTNSNLERVELFFVISDTGIGISEEDKKKLFKSFTQVDGSITRRFGGTGLGLTISKNLVQLMDGSIKVDSKKGEGSAFSFSVQLGMVKGEEIEADNNQYPTGSFVFKDYYNNRFKNEMNAENSDSMTQTLDIGAMNFSFTPANFDEIEQNEEAENIKEIKDLIDKLGITIDLENGEKADNFATQIKKKLPEDRTDEKRLAFKISLSVRKEEYAAAKEFFDEMKEKLSDI
ncbi:MAG: ATP-binding protein [Lachnospiraceae bacterium]|nr:ATP-binding protein [Lachnospiraceae bacterium]